MRHITAALLLAGTAMLPSHQAAAQFNPLAPIVPLAVPLVEPPAVPVPEKLLDPLAEPPAVPAADPLARPLLDAAAALPAHEPTEELLYVPVAV